MQTKNSEEIIGRWEAVQTTRGGLGSALEFSRDGSFKCSFGPLMRGTYTLDGNHLTEKVFQSDGSQTTESRKIEILGDILIMEADDAVEGLKISFVRLTPRDPDSSPIMGRWGQQVPVQFYDFKADGSLVISGDVSDIPCMLTDTTYKLDRNRLTISGLASNTKERVEQSCEISFEGNTLIQKDSNGLELRMQCISQDKPDKPSIIGKWKVDNSRYQSMIESSIVEYTKSGEWAYRMSIGAGEGRYSISGDLLTTTLATETKISKFRFENGCLLLQSPPDEGPEDKFKRISFE